MPRPPALAAEEKTRIVLSILAGETAGFGVDELLQGVFGDAPDPVGLGRVVQLGEQGQQGRVVIGHRVVPLL